MTRNSANFTFDGISSQDFGVVSVGFGGLEEQTIIPQRTVVEIKSRYTDTPYFQMVETEPLSFPLTIFIKEWKDRDNLRQIIRWLFHGNYKPLIFENRDRVYYAILDGESTLFHNGLQQGYITLNVRCNSPYSYRQPIQVEAEGNSLYVFNSGDMPVMANLFFKKTVANGFVDFRNTTNGSNFRMYNLLKDEEVYVNGTTQEITSSLEDIGVFRYDDHNDDSWITLDLGDNHIEIIQFEDLGHCELSAQFQEKYYF